MYLNNELGDFVSDLSSSINAVECGEKLIELFSRFGAHAANIWTDYGYSGKITGNYPEHWRKHIYDMGWGEEHHVCLLSKQSMQPITWGVDITPHDPRRNEFGVQVVETAHDAFKARSAVTFPVHSFNGQQNGGISFVTNMPKKEFMAFMSDSLELLQSASILTHQRIQLLNQKSGINMSKVLAPREKECVKWLASGSRTHQVAERMGIRDVTVNLYVQNAKKKLRARTREQLIATSIIDGHVSV